MAYIDKEYYKQFGGSNIPDNFERIAEIASDIIDTISVRPIDSNNTEQYALVQKATAYQVEMLNEQGGIDSIVGFASSTSVSSESLGTYSVTNNSNTQTSIKTINGIPVSTMALSLLKKAGLMSRWAYIEKWRKHHGK